MPHAVARSPRVARARGGSFTQHLLYPPLFQIPCSYMTTNNTSFNTNEALFYAPDGTLAFKWVY